MTIKPRALRKGSTIGICAASSPFPHDKFLKGVETLESLGFVVRFNEDIFRKKDYLAGSDEERAAELDLMMNDPEVAAIMFARGGYGIQRTLPLLDLSEFKNRPKIVVGYSDLTPLLSYLSTQLGVACFYGPVITGLAERNEETISSLVAALTSSAPVAIGNSHKFSVIKEGEVRGRLIGGCLALLSTSVGTEYDLNTDGSILFIEDRGEKVYQYDRMLTHLRNSGILHGVGGIIFGSMGVPPEETNAKILWSMIKDVLYDFSGPIVSGLNVGHTTPFVTLPLGISCSLSARGSSVKLTFEEGALV